MTRTLFLLLAGLLLAGADKPLVIESGQTKQLPAATALQLSAPTTANATVNMPHGTAPTSPTNGDCWTTTAALTCRINGANASLAGSNTGDQTISLTGDVTGSGTGSFATTLATVNSSAGTFGSATQSLTATVNGKGLITALSAQTVTPAATSITGAGNLTKTDDTNVTLTLGGTPTGSTLKSVSITAGWTGQLGVTRGGTGLASIAQGDLLYGSASNTLSALAKSTTASRYLSNGGTTNNPAWSQVDLSNGVTGRLPFANLTQPSALSVLGVTGSSAADAASIVGTADQILRVNGAGTALAFGSIDLSKSAAVGTSRLALANIAQGTALSVRGVAGNATADVADIAAGSDNQVLRRSGTAVGFGAVNIASSSAVTGTLPTANGGTNTDVGTAWTTCTTTIAAGAGAFTTTSTLACRYKQVGKIIFLRISILITTNGTANSYFTLTAPVASGNIDANAYQAIYCTSAGAAGLAGRAVLQNNSTTIFVTKYDGTYLGQDNLVVNLTGIYEAA